ncbi:MAG TPA: agmatinase [Vicinamibacterales bacterium]|nr:agmatinase [Vicinamibacterales bacterium]
MPDVFSPNRVQYGGPSSPRRTWKDADAFVLPIPFEQTTSYGKGTARGPAALLTASLQVELWDEELGTDVHTTNGVFTSAGLTFGRPKVAAALRQIQTAAARVVERDRFLVSLGGEHSITAPLVAAVALKTPGVTVLQIDAHADLRDQYLDEPNSHACAMRRTLEYAPVVQVGIRNISEDEAKAVPSLRTRIFYDWNMRTDPAWVDAVVDALGPNVYVTIDLDGLEPGLMPGVGTPEPGGLSWRELMTLLRRTFERRNVVACDVVELCPLKGIISPDFAAARLVYKLLTYKFATRRA